MVILYSKVFRKSIFFLNFFGKLGEYMKNYDSIFVVNKIKELLKIKKYLRVKC